MTGLKSAVGWINTKELPADGEECRWVAVWADKRCILYLHVNNEKVISDSSTRSYMQVCVRNKKREKGRVSAVEDKSSLWESPDWVNSPHGKRAELFVFPWEMEVQQSPRCWTQEGRYLAEEIQPESLEKDTEKLLFFVCNWWLDFKLFTPCFMKLLVWTARGYFEKHASHLAFQATKK